MSNKQQTAVEWFAERIQSDKIFNFEKVLEQAKEMEKEQIEQAHYAPKYGCFSEQYYNETYGGN